MKSTVQRVVGRARRTIRGHGFNGSSSYWAQRYATGGDSGAGSYGKLATFKADVLNKFLESHSIEKVIEFGVGDGAQLASANYPAYIGLDVAAGSIDLCARKFADDPTKSFYLYAQDQFVDRERLFHADLALSLDVVFHLVEDPVFDRYMRILFAAADRYVIVYASNRNGSTAPHVRHREFTTWVTANEPDWVLEQTVENPHWPYPAEPRSDFFVFARTADV